MFQTHHTPSLRYFFRIFVAQHLIQYICTLFYKQRFFSNEPQCSLTFSWIELQLLVRNHHHTVTHFIFNIFVSIFVSMSRPRSIYVGYIWSIFHFQSYFLAIQSSNNKHYNRHTCFGAFLWNIYYLWMITWMNKANNFQIANVQPQGVA